MIKYKVSALFIFVIVCMSSCTTTYYISRHGEFTEIDGEFVLTPVGLETAENLKLILENKGVDSVFVSNEFRTEQTAQPLLDHLGIEHAEPKWYWVTEEALFERLFLMPANYQVLIVGHANTIPDVINHLMDQEIYPEDQFLFGLENFYIIKVRRASNRRLLIISTFQEQLDALNP